jgi:hypothetical protein
MWALGAAGLGFAVSSLFAGALHVPRNVFVLPYALAVFAYVYAYVRWSRVRVLSRLRQHWDWGLVGAVLAGTFVVGNVLSQPASPAPGGLELAWLLVWLGVVYGSADALLLSIIPVAATWQAFATLGWTRTWPGRIAAGILALAASMLVAATYHLGFPEYGSGGLLAPIIGNSVMSLEALLDDASLPPGGLRRAWRPRIWHAPRRRTIMSRPERLDSAALLVMTSWLARFVAECASVSVNDRDRLSPVERMPQDCQL